jgi:flavin reductase (DIM6/NTAB) family NADH-FMN oxidoreductase RutF
MSITPDAYRTALRFFPSGVTLVTIRSGADIHGLTVSAFSSVSPDPPLILVCIDHRHLAHVLLERDGAAFAVNVLRADQAGLSDRFAHAPAAERFQDGDWGARVTGAPVLSEALAWLDCTVHSRLPAGTHTVYLGEVQASGANEAAHPLVYWNRGYRTLDGGPG